MRAINRIMRGSACAVVAGALAVGVGVGPANADPIEDPSEPGSETTEPETTTVRLKVGKREGKTVETEASRPWGLLEEVGVEIDGNDKVRVLRNGDRVRDREKRVLRDGDRVRVIKVRHAVRHHTVRFDRKKKVRKVATLAPGVRRVEKKGRDGIRKLRVDLELHNGRTVKREVHKRWVRRPQPKVVHVGKKQPWVAGTGHLNWGALARCESGGNPRAVNPSGYYGLYQFSPATWRGVGGSGMPHHASSSEQTYRAKKLYAAQGRSPWPHCGRYL
ncbi:MAG: transglycosylase family protein [Nocardioides sp.]